MFFKCICKITFIKWDFDKRLNLQSAQQSSTITGIDLPPLKLCVSPYLVCDHDLVCEPDFPVLFVGMFCHFPWHEQMQFVMRRQMQRKMAIWKKTPQKQTSTNKSTAHKHFQLEAYTHYNPK